MAPELITNGKPTRAAIQAAAFAKKLIGDIVQGLGLVVAVSGTPPNYKVQSHSL